MTKTALASNVARLSVLLTRERESLPAAYLKDAGLRRAYIEYFLPANLYKIHIPLEELSLHPGGLFKRDKLRILDIGSGPGTATLGALDFFSLRKKRPVLEFTAVDPVAENLKDAEALFKERSHEGCTLTSLKSGIEKIETIIKGQFDIILLSNLLNEVAYGDAERIPKRIAVLKSLLTKFLAPDGSCIIIEPALRETSREMLMVRDGLLDEGLYIYSPCLMGDKCPALENSRDWCHEDIPWEPPEIIKEVDRLTGLRKDSLKFSYMVFRKDRISLTDVFGENSYRVVSEPLISKGKIDYYVCGAGGRRMATRLDKDKTASNNEFERLRRGYLVEFKGVLDDGKRLRVGKECAVILK